MKGILVGVCILGLALGVWLGRIFYKSPEMPATVLRNGTTMLLFPEWETSDSAFERIVYTNYYVVYSNGQWFTRERQNDGTLAQLWKTDHGNKDIHDAKFDFDLNIQWNIYRAMYDALSGTGGKE